MARSTKTQKALNLNAAHGLLSRGSSVAEAVTILARERNISLRQAYRYLQGARGLGRAIPVGEPSVPATFKIPRDVLTQLRAYSRRSGLPLSAIVTEAIEKRLTAPTRGTNDRGGNPQPPRHGTDGAGRRTGAVQDA